MFSCATAKKASSRYHWPRVLPFLISVALAVIAGGVCTLGVARAQQPQSSPDEPQLRVAVEPPVGKLSSRVRLVTVYATVRDKHEKIISNLTKADFALEEDGRPQTISNFVVQSDAPLTLGLLVETSFSQRSVLVPERNASYAFLDHMLSQQDVAFVIHFDRQVELLQDLTSSRLKLQAALQQLDTPRLAQSNENGGDTGGRGDRGDMRGGTHLYDAIWLASKDLMKKQPGRKALFVLSDGVDRGSKESLADSVEAAQRADTAVYTIYFAGEEPQGREPGRRGHWGGMGGPVDWPQGPGNFPGGGGSRYPREPRVDGKKILLQVSEQTGGVMFEVSKNLPLDRIYSAAAEGLRNQYSIGYTPNPPDSDPGYHTIRLTANKRDLTVQTRQGYYSGR